MKLSDLQNLTLDNVGTWPLPAKAVGIGAVCLAILIVGFYKISQPQFETLTTAEQLEVDKMQELAFKQAKAANLEALKQQLVDIQESFGDMLRRLPDKTEVAALLVDISQQGVGAGLEFELFRPGSEEPAEFYAELPIQIRVVGNYHEFGQFISGVSGLPRIVTNHNIKIIAKGTDLVMDTTAKTYRYLDEDEPEQ